MLCPPCVPLDLSAVSHLDLSAVSRLCPACVPPGPQCCVPHEGARRCPQRGEEKAGRRQEETAGLPLSSPTDNVMGVMATPPPSFWYMATGHDFDLL